MLGGKAAREEKRGGWGAWGGWVQTVLQDDASSCRVARCVCVCVSPVGRGVPRESVCVRTLTDEAAAVFPGGCIVHVVVCCAGMNGSAVRSAADGHWRNPPSPPGASRLRREGTTSNI
jgi:hypothetical protein